MARTKSEWARKSDELKAQLPEKFDGKQFRKCRKDGKLDKGLVVNTCTEKGFKDKTDAVFAYLVHQDSKPKAEKRGKGKQKNAESVTSEVNLLSKRTYANLSCTEIDRVIEMLVSVRKDRKDSEIAKLEAEKNRIDQELKALKSK